MIVEAMSPTARIAIVIGLLVVLWLAVGRAQSRMDELTPAPAGARYSLVSDPRLPQATRDAGLQFAPDVVPGDRDAINAAVAAARPEAQRLIALVDGLVSVRVGPTPGDAVGVTSTSGGDAGYDVLLDLPRVFQQHGTRGVTRVVLHELAHVVDHAIVTDALMQSLDAGIPHGAACDPGLPTGACAEVEERFAETFAKWATGDIGIDLYVGYKVPPPASLEAWGAPLAALPAG